jgi:queuosine precursor transporter
MQIKYLDALLALYITTIIASELMGSKIFTLFGVNASVAIFLLPITFSINDIVTEVYGKKRAISFVQSGLLMLVFLLFFNLLTLALPPATRFAPTNEAYTTVFGKSLRIILASLTAFWLAERFDVLVFSKLRQRFGTSRLWLRNNLSNFLSQLCDTTIFMVLAFYKPGNEWFLLSLIWPYWVLKCCMSVIETPLTYVGVSLLKKEKHHD